MPIVKECFDYLAANATGKWHETFRLKSADSDRYVHAIQRDMVVLRVETRTKRRAFYWLYNVQDALKFNQYVGLTLKAEAHEIITTPRCRMFYDIDLKLSEYQKSELAESMGIELTYENEMFAMEDIGKRLAGIFKEATIVSLEYHGIDRESDLSGFDWFATMRNRPLDNDGFKISIHIITNLIVPLKACAAIAKHVQSSAIQENIEAFGISADVAELLIGAVDAGQYHRNGSLSLPFGTKWVGDKHYTNWIRRDYDIPQQYFLITAEDMFSVNDVDVSEYNIAPDSHFAEANPDFVAEALRHVDNIPDYSTRAWDITTSILRKSTMFVKRYAPSMCSVCNRVHDNDNTLFLIFNSDRGTASWKCVRRPDVPPKIFYRAQATIPDHDVVEAFAQRQGARRQEPQRQGARRQEPQRQGARRRQPASQARPPAEDSDDYIPMHPADAEYSDEDARPVKKEKTKIEARSGGAAVATPMVVAETDSGSDTAAAKPPRAKGIAIQVRQAGVDSSEAHHVLERESSSDSDTTPDASSSSVFIRRRVSAQPRDFSASEAASEVEEISDSD